MSKNGVFETIPTQIDEIIKKLDKLDSKLDGNISSVEALRKSFSDLGEEAEKTAKNTEKGTKSLEKAVKTITLDSAIRTIEKGYKTFEKLVKSSVDYIEDLNLLKVAFGDTADEAYNLTKNIASITGYDEATLGRNLGTFRNLTSTLALTNEQADLLATNLEKMSLDISSLYNTSLDRSAYALTGMLTGQPRTIKTLTGANITQQALNNELAIMGIDRKANSLNQAEKAMEGKLGKYKSMMPGLF